MEAKVIEWQTKLVELSNAKDKVQYKYYYYYYYYYLRVEHSATPRTRSAGCRETV